MEPRVIAAYLLILLIGLFVATVIGYHIYHSHERSYARRLRREARERRREEALEAGRRPGD